MKVNIKKLILFVITMIMLIGCSKQSEPPAGVHNKDGYTFYIINLSYDHILSSDFKTNNQANQIVSNYNYGNDTTSTYYSAVTEGGWIAYDQTRQGLIAYFPPDFPEDYIAISIAQLVSKTSNYMTLEDSMAYIPWLDNYIYDYSG
ncbi:MAG: hypothetical protein IJX76_10015 [Clostridia bacterium]|nr:hypothetical protein [Clostridia bacterium]